MTMLGISRMVMAIRISSNKATVGVAISGKPSPEAPLTKAANSKAMPTRIRVGSKFILNQVALDDQSLYHEAHRLLKTLGSDCCRRHSHRVHLGKRYGLVLCPFAYRLS